MPQLTELVRGYNRLIIYITLLFIHTEMLFVSISFFIFFRQGEIILCAIICLRNWSNKILIKKYFTVLWLDSKSQTHTCGITIWTIKWIESLNQKFNVNIPYFLKFKHKCNTSKNYLFMCSQIICFHVPKNVYCS